MRQMWVLLAAILFSLTVSAADNSVNVSSAWSRATAPGQSSAGVWFTLTSKQDATLVFISSSAAKRAQIHSMTHENGMMKMRAIESLALPAGKAVELAPGGNHVMLFDLKQPLKAGDHVPLKLTLRYADKHETTLAVTAEVRAQDVGSSDAHDHMHMH